VISVTRRCGIIGADARPNRREMRASENWLNGAAVTAVAQRGLANRSEEDPVGLGVRLRLVGCVN
jgi:hypothetical protein